MLLCRSTSHTVRSRHIVAHCPRQPRLRKSRQILRPTVRRHSRSTVHIVAFLKEDQRVEVAMDYYKVLGLNRVASREACAQAIELAQQPPDVGYSVGTLESRAAILQQMLDTLATTANRRSYDQALRDGSARMSLAASDLPGAMVLLQEAGESNAVLHWSSAWIQDNPKHAAVDDVLLVVALTHCDMAASLLEQDPEAVVQAGDYLQTALDVLQPVKLAHNLSPDIQAALKNLAPRSALKLVSLPLSEEHQEARAEGVNILKHVVWHSAEFPQETLRMARPSYLHAARSHLTATEQVAVFEAAPSDATPEPDTTYNAALAYIMDGYSAFHPAHIQTADKLLSSLVQHQRSTPGADGELGPSMELAVCKVLLCKSDEAACLLGLGGEQAAALDPAIAEFVKAHSPDKTDLGPGLAALAEQWLQDMAGNGYRGGTARPLAPLDAWFNHSSVAVYLKVMAKGAGAAGAAQAVGQGMKVFVGGLADLMSGVPKDPETADDEPVRERGSTQQAAAGRSSSHAVTSASGRAAGVDTAQKGLPALPACQSQQRRRTSKPPSSMVPDSIENDSAAAPLQLLDGEQEMWHNTWHQTSPQNGARDIAVGALLLLGSAAGVVFWRHRGGHSVPAALQQPVAAAMVLLHGTKAATEGGAVLSQRQAAQLVGRWQAVKSAAMGPAHQVEALEDVLEGNMLADWQARALDLQEQNWHWKYHLKQLVVQDIETADDGSMALVRVKLNESAELFANGAVADTYASTYCLEYILSRRASDWRLTSSRVVS